MDIYLLEKDYGRLKVIDEFHSFIWTERMSSPGDFELVLPFSDKWDDLIIDRLITHSETNQAMFIEERYETEDQDGERLLSIKGRSLVTLLDRRGVFPVIDKPSWETKGTVGDAVVNLVKTFAMSASLATFGGDKDIIPEIFTFKDTLKDPIDREINEYAIKRQSLYTAVKELCDAYDYTFGIDLRPTSPKLRFYVIKGQLRNVHFGIDLDTLSESSFIHSKADHYNIAYIWSKDFKDRLSIPAKSGNVSGVDRRVLIIDANDISDDENLSHTENAIRRRSQMIQRAKTELAKHKEVKILDGKVSRISSFVYGTHYRIGDTVMLIDAKGRKQKVRVSEYIFAQDREGARSYPTFTLIDE